MGRYSFWPPRSACVRQQAKLTVTASQAIEVEKGHRAFFVPQSTATKNGQLNTLAHNNRDRAMIAKTRQPNRSPHTAMLTKIRTEELIGH
jgi:hypothetical protein